MDHMVLLSSGKQRQKAAILFSFWICLIVAATRAADPAASEIRKGFSVKHDGAYAQFQPILDDPTGNFSLGFLRIDSNLLDLAVLHRPSSFPIWRAVPANPAPWTGSIALSFNGTLVLSDRNKGTVFWSAGTGGDRVILLNSSNLQVQKTGATNTVLWQSFDFPSDTIVENQNFTSYAELLSTNQQYSMSLGTNYFALYIEYGKGGNNPPAIYFKHTALEAKAEIAENGGPIYARISSEGFLGMYQKEGPPVDVLSFDTFNRNYDVFYRMTLEDNGNLKAYYWNNSTWNPDYTAITEPCDLPSTCGAYSICRPQEQPQCICLTNSTDGCLQGGGGNGDFCAAGVADTNNYGYWFRTGVDLANKDTMNSTKMASYDECYGACQNNCRCWGAVYSNITQRCYTMDYPAQMLVEADDKKFGFFKFRPQKDQDGDGEYNKGSKTHKWRVALLVIGCGVLVGAGGYGVYRIWERKGRRRGGSTEDGLEPGPYKDLAAASFKSIQLSDSFRKS